MKEEILTKKNPKNIHVTDKEYNINYSKCTGELSLHEIKLKVQYYYQVEKKAFFSKGKYMKFTKRWQDYLHLVEDINWYLSSYIILWIIICSFVYKSVHERDVLVCICWKNDTLYNNLTIWYYTFTQNIVYCYTYCSLVYEIYYICIISHIIYKSAVNILLSKYK